MRILPDALQPELPEPGFFEEHLALIFCVAAAAAAVTLLLIVFLRKKK